MSRQLPLTIPNFQAVFGNDPYTADEPPKEYQEIEALPDLKAKLEYFNKNLCSLAHDSEGATYWGWKEPLSVMHRQPCKCGKHTPADFEVFQEMRAKEVKRLIKELNKRETYGEKIAYLITQPGFSLVCLIIDEDINLHPAKRPAADVAAFNEISKAEFYKNYFPQKYKGLLFSKEKEVLEAELAKADDPDYQVKKYRQQIEIYTGYKQPVKSDDDERHLSEREKLIKKIVSKDSSNDTAKDTFLKLAAGMDAMPNLQSEPLYFKHWEAIEHGQQVFKLYQWLGQWLPGKTFNEAKEKTLTATITWLKDWPALQRLIKGLEDADFIPKGEGEEWAGNAFSDTSGNPLKPTGHNERLQWNGNDNLLGYLINQLVEGKWIIGNKWAWAESCFINSRGKPVKDLAQKMDISANTKAGKPLKAEIVDGIISALPKTS